MGFTCEYLEPIRWKWSNTNVTWYLEMLLNKRQWHDGKWRIIHCPRNLNFDQALEDILLELILILLRDVIDALRIPLLSETLW